MGNMQTSYPPRRTGLIWPAVLITLGLILLLDQLVPGLNFGRTWPLILVVIGVMSLVDSSRPPRPPEGPRI